MFGELLGALRRSGALRPMRPDRAVRLLFPPARFGAGPAVAGAVAALRFPGRTAVVDERGAVTCAELERRAAALATALPRLLPPKGAIGVMCRNHRGLVEAILAGSRLGRDLVLLNTDFSGPQLAAVLDREGVGLVILDEEFLPVCAFSGPRVVAWHDGATGLPSLDALVAVTEPEPLVTARPGRLVILTSGTTGTPKGARHELTAAGALGAGLTHLLRVPLRSGDPIVVGPPAFHTLGLAYVLAGLALGMPVVLSRRFDAAAALRAIAEHRAGAFIGVPLLLRRLLDVPDKPDTSSLTAVVCAGAALPPSLATAFMDEFGDVLCNVYGATETGWATIATPRDLREAPGTTGRPSLGVTVRLYRPDGTEAGEGETGEIFVGGGLRFTGYTGGGGRQVRDGLTSTGDMGHFDTAGRLFVDGRADDMIVSGGENVFPAEVEDLLSRHPAVSEVAVVGVPDEVWGQRLEAHIVRAKDTDPAKLAEDLTAHVRTHLARYKVPRAFHFPDALPRTATGKVKTTLL